MAKRNRQSKKSVVAYLAQEDQRLAEILENVRAAFIEEPDLTRVAMSIAIDSFQDLLTHADVRVQSRRGDKERDKKVAVLVKVMAHAFLFAGITHLENKRFEWIEDGLIQRPDGW